MTPMDKTFIVSILLLVVFYMWVAFSMAISRQTVMPGDLPMTSSLNYIIFVTGDFWNRKTHPIAWRMSAVIRFQRLSMIKI